MAEPAGSTMANALRQGSGKRRMLVQSPSDAAKWEALQILGDGPQDFSRTELDTQGAARYQQNGGFEIVERPEFDAELVRLSEALRAQRGAPAPMPSKADLLRQQVVERSGAGAPGRVYAEEDGEAVQVPLESAEERGLRVLGPEEASEMMGRASPPPLPHRAASAVADVRMATGRAGSFPLSELEEGLGEPYATAIQRRTPPAGPPQAQRPVDPRMLAQALRGGR